MDTPYIVPTLKLPSGNGANKMSGIGSRESERGKNQSIFNKHRRVKFHWRHIDGILIKN
jgi:hypothetical protein